MFSLTKAEDGICLTKSRRQELPCKGLETGFALNPIIMGFSLQMIGDGICLAKCKFCNYGICLTRVGDGICLEKGKSRNYGICLTRVLDRICLAKGKSRNYGICLARVGNMIGLVWVKIISFIVFWDQDYVGKNNLFCSVLRRGLCWH